MVEIFAKSIKSNYLFKSQLNQNYFNDSLFLFNLYFQSFFISKILHTYDITFVNKVNPKAEVIRSTPTTKGKTWISENIHL